MVVDRAEEDDGEVGGDDEPEEGGEPVDGLVFLVPDEEKDQAGQQETGDEKEIEGVHVH